MTSAALGGLPVLTPVTMIVSAPMNSAASAMSPKVRSAVQACDECFFLMSAQTCTSVAPIMRRYRNSFAAFDSMIPSSAM